MINSQFILFGHIFYHLDMIINNGVLIKNFLILIHKHDSINNFMNFAHRKNKKYYI